MNHISTLTTDEQKLLTTVNNYRIAHQRLATLQDLQVMTGKGREELTDTITSIIRKGYSVRLRGFISTGGNE